MTNSEIAITAVLTFCSFFIGFFNGWLQRDAQSPTIEIDPSRPAPEPDFRCERYRRELGFRASLECELCGRGPRCQFGVGDLEARARLLQ